jgi:hypothetical protein
LPRSGIDPKPHDASASVVRRSQMPRLPQLAEIHDAVWYLSAFRLSSHLRVSFATFGEINEVSPFRVSKLSLYTECTSASWATGPALRRSAGLRSSNPGNNRRSSARKQAAISALMGGARLERKPHGLRRGSINPPCAVRSGACRANGRPRGRSLRTSGERKVCAGKTIRPACGR